LKEFDKFTDVIAEPDVGVKNSDNKLTFFGYTGPENVNQVTFLRQVCLTQQRSFPPRWV
jgi:hypothetical protein